MENTNSAVMTQVSSGAPVGNITEVPMTDSGVGIESLSEEAGNTFEQEDEFSHEFDFNPFSEPADSEIKSPNEYEDNSFEASEEELIEQAREELDEIKKDTEEPEPEKDNGYDEQLETLNATIILLEAQRDALKEQLGGGLVTFVMKLADYFFAETLTDKSSLLEESAIGESSEVWKEDARLQLRKIETKISELKHFRDRLVAKNTL